MTALILLAHGSSSPQTREEVLALCENIRKTSGEKLIQPAFLTGIPPDLAGAVDTCAGQGARQIIILPHFLNSGGHILQDLPRLVAEARDRYPEIQFAVTRPVGLEPEISEIYVRQIREMTKGS